MKILSVIGFGGHTRSSINLIKQYFKNYKIAIYDDSFDLLNPENILGIKLNGKVIDIPKKSSIFLSIGDNYKRKEYFIKFEKEIVKDNLFHNSSKIEEKILFGISNQIYANVYINSYVKIGNNNIINSSSILEHEVKIGNDNHIGVGAKVCGRASIGNRCFIGAGAIVIDKVSISDDVTIGAGTVVIKDIKEKGTYVGNPARRIK